MYVALCVDDCLCASAYVCVRVCVLYTSVCVCTCECVSVLFEPVCECVRAANVCVSVNTQRQQATEKQQQGMVRRGTRK